MKQIAEHEALAFNAFDHNGVHIGSAAFIMRGDGGWYIEVRGMWKEFKVTRVKRCVTRSDAEAALREYGAVIFVDKDNPK